MQVSNFNKVHKNGSVSYRVAGTSGAVYIAKSQLRADFPVDNPPATLEEALSFLVAPGADATAKSAEKLEAARVRDEAKLAKATAAIEKSNARLVKLQDQATAAAARAAAALAKAQGQ